MEDINARTCISRQGRVTSTIAASASDEERNNTPIKTIDLSKNRPGDAVL